MSHLTRPTRFDPSLPSGSLAQKALTMSVLIALTLTACQGRSSQSAAAGAQNPGTESNEIHWYEGEVDDAFTYAQASGKPTFLYWGAEWCPPCHYLKNKIFTQPEFVTRMANFVPVYLDGDTKSAQIWGERLNVLGYPTVIIFSPAGDEVMRMSSSVPVDQYATVLDQAMTSNQPIEKVLSRVLEQGPAAAATSDLNLLANYSWSQADDSTFSPSELTAAFRRLFEETPTTYAIQRSRFLASYVTSLVAKNQDAGGSPAKPIQQHLSLVDPILELLGNATLREPNLVFVSFGAPEKIDFLTPEGSDRRSELVEAWTRAARAIESDAALTVDDRLGGTLALVTIHNRVTAESSSDQTPPVDSTRQNHIRDQIAWGLEAAKGPSQRQSALNTMGHILDRAGMYEEAEALMRDNLQDTSAPYYFMEWVADLREQDGDIPGALEWYRNAYDHSTGRYSRFRYGSTYLKKLMELDPDNVAVIEAASEEILGELLEHSDAFAGGNYSRLASLQTAYRDWESTPQAEASVQTIRELVLASCDRHSGGDGEQQKSRCRSFLEDIESGQVVM